MLYDTIIVNRIKLRKRLTEKARHAAEGRYKRNYPAFVGGVIAGTFRKRYASHNNSTDMINKLRHPYFNTLSPIKHIMLFLIASLITYPDDLCIRVIGFIDLRHYLTGICLGYDVISACQDPGRYGC